MVPLRLRVFTHPACSGCPEAVRAAWTFTESRPEVELETITLAEKDGLATARRARVTVIPAVILQRDDEELGRWTGFPPDAELEAAVQTAIDAIDTIDAIEPPIESATG